MSAHVEAMPSILGGRSAAASAATKDAALRKRGIATETVVREAALAARAKALWAQQWRATTTEMLPMTTRPTTGATNANSATFKPSPLATTTGVAYTSLEQTEFWSKTSLFGLPRKKLLLYVHAVCCVVHSAMCVLCLVVTAQSNDPYIDVARQRFVFTRNSTECGRLTNFTAAGEQPVLAVLVPSGKVHVGIASAMFFLLSGAAHGAWSLACVWEPLGGVLLPLLSDAFAPLRWLEYSASASLMLFVLALASGVRNETDLASIFVLVACTMAGGYWTELFSRPDPESGGLRWTGQRADNSNRFRNYVYRMQIHVMSFVPYATAWAIVIRLYDRTLADVEEAFGLEVNDRIPAYIITALTTTFITYSSFTHRSLTQIYFQWVEPAKYWASEIVYAVLSLSAKLLLGILLLVNLLAMENANDGAAG